MARQEIMWRADDGSLHSAEADARMHDDQVLLAKWLEGHPHLRWANASSPTAVASVLLMDAKCPFEVKPKAGIRDAEAVAEPGELKKPA